MLSFLKKPYPYHPFSVKDLYTFFFIGCFTFLFLFIFQPFDIALWHPDHKTLKLAGFGAVSFVGALVMKLASTSLFSNTRQQDQWNIWKEATAIALTLMLVAFGNLVFAFCIGIAPINWQSFAYAMLSVLLVGVFPIAATITLKYNRFMRLNQSEAAEIGKEIAIQDTRQKQQGAEHPEAGTGKTLALIAENNKDRLELLSHELLYIESADNYVTVVFTRNGQKKKELLRSSLKRIELQVAEETIVRCHRAFIVNLGKIAHIEGNAQGYRLSFSETEDTIPVSRAYGKAILEKLRSLH